MLILSVKFMMLLIFKLISEYNHYNKIGSFPGSFTLYEINVFIVFKYDVDYHKIIVSNNVYKFIK